jgi:NAD(P)-dependent dehydrogenase (short-subunit alcohol dehydrogenase family)
MRDLAGKVAVVTGGGSPRGIGRATGALLAAQGMRVVLADVNEHHLGETVAELRNTGAEVVGVPTDVSDFDSVRNLAAEVFGRFGKAHVVFLNAGIGGGGSLFDDELDSWHRVIGVNLMGVLHGIKSFVPRMLDQGEPAHLLATSSGAGVNGVMYSGASYAATKQAVCTLMECLYGQLRDLGADIRTTVVLPPLAKTNLAGDPATMLGVEQGLRAAGVPAVLVEPEEVAAVVLDAIRDDSFWAHPTHEQDVRIFGGRLKAGRDWLDEVTLARAGAIVGRTTPDPYLWSGGGGSGPP